VPQLSSEALSLIESLLEEHGVFFSRGYLNSEGRKLVARLLRVLAEGDRGLFNRVKRLYPEAPEDRWLEVLKEVRDALVSHRK